MKVNIVMLTRDRRKLFIQAIKTLYKNTPSELYNLTVIDDQSAMARQDTGWDRPDLEPPLAEVLTGNTTACSLRIGHSKGITGQARNLGVYWTEKYWGRGDYLCLLDNDLYFTPGWLEKMIAVADALKLSTPIIGGWNHPYLQPHKRTVPYFASFNLHVETHDAVSGACQLMEWKTWDKYGPLDAHAVGVGQSEDWKMCQDIIKDGGYVGSIYPRVVFNCGVTNSFGQPGPGADVMLMELQQAKLTHPGLYW